MYSYIRVFLLNAIKIVPSLQRMLHETKIRKAHPWRFQMTSVFSLIELITRFTACYTSSLLNIKNRILTQWNPRKATVDRQTNEKAIHNFSVVLVRKFPLSNASPPAHSEHGLGKPTKPHRFQTNSVAFGMRANYTSRATAACRRS
jgi:hypothetical protein